MYSDARYNVCTCHFKVLAFTDDQAPLTQIGNSKLRDSIVTLRASLQEACEMMRYMQ